MEYKEGSASALAKEAPHPSKIPDEWTVDREDAPARSRARRHWDVPVQIAAALLLIGCAVLFSVKGIDDRDARLYQLAYVVLLGAGGLLGLLVSRRVRRPGYSFNWDVPAMLGVVLLLSMLMMQPLLLMMVLIRSTPPWIHTQPATIILLDLGLIVLGGLIGLLGYLFSTPVGWLVVLVSVAVMAAFAGMALTTPVTHAALLGVVGGG